MNINKNSKNKIPNTKDLIYDSDEDENDNENDNENEDKNVYNTGEFMDYTKSLYSYFIDPDIYSIKFLDKHKNKFSELFESTPPYPPLFDNLIKNQNTLFDGLFFRNINNKFPFHLAFNTILLNIIKKKIKLKFIKDYIKDIKKSLDKFHERKDGNYEHNGFNRKNTE